MRAGYSSSQGFGGLAGSQRFSPPVFWPYGIPLNVKTPPSRKPRTLPYRVFATAERGVEQLPGSWCAAVLVLSDARVVRGIAAPRPAAAESNSAWRRLSLWFWEFGLDMGVPFIG